MPVFNEEILRNKNFHCFHKRNDKRWLLTLPIYALTGNKNELVQSKVVVAISIITMSLLGSKILHAFLEKQLSCQVSKPQIESKFKYFPYQLPDF